MKLDSEALYQEGIEAHRRGEWSQAIALYRHAIDHYAIHHRNLAGQPQSPHLHYPLGRLLDQQGSLDSAIEQYAQTLALDPNHQGARENLGCAYLKRGQVDKAIATLKTAIAAHPRRASLWNNLGQALKANDQLEEAIAAFDQAIHLQPDLVIPHLNLGYLWLELERRDKAIAQFQAVLSLDPHHLAAHSHCAQLYFQQGHLAAAVDHWRQIANQQRHLLVPYCQQVQQEQPEPSDHSQDLEDFRYQARQSCAQFLQDLLKHETSQTVSQHLQQTYEHWGTLIMQAEDGAPLADYYLRQALRIQPTHIGLLQKLAQALERQQHWNSAIALQTLRKTEDQRSKIEDSPTLPHPPTPSLPHSPTPPPYCHSSTLDWANTTAIAPLYRPIPWPFQSPLSPRKGNAPVLAPPVLA
ncbi:MAG: tetratricopeptide repeat protein, partial [Leptolyngbyaceae cyanobacterium]